MLGYARLVATVLVVWFTAMPLVLEAASKRSQRSRNQQRSAAARAAALQKALTAARSRVERAEVVANQAASTLQRLGYEAGESRNRFRVAVSELDQADNEKFGASQELAELRAKIEKFEPEDSPLKKTRAEYDAALEELAEIRIDILESDKYQLLYEGAKQSPNQAEELERVMRVCFEEDSDYVTAKERVDNARMAYDKIRYALYEADPAWAPAVERAKAAALAYNQAATSVKASGVESGIERINAREAEQRHALAQSVLADARSNLKRIEAQKKKVQTASKSGSQSDNKPAKKIKK